MGLTGPRKDQPGDPGCGPRRAQGRGQTRGCRSAGGPQAGPERARASLPAIMAAGSSKRSRRARSSSRGSARAAGRAGRALAAPLPQPLGCAGSRAPSKKRLGSRSAGPPAWRARAGLRAGARGRGAPWAASPRGRARGAAGRGAGSGRRIRCSRRRPRPRARALGGGCMAEGGGGRGRALSSPAVGMAGAPGGLVGILGTAEALTSLRNGGAGLAGTAVAPGRSLGAAGPWAPGFPPRSFPSSPVPPSPRPRPDPAAKGWAGKRALWDRCQLRDKRHKIGGNGGSAAGALRRGRRSRGGLSLGADRAKFGKSPGSLAAAGEARAGPPSAPRSFSPSRC